MNSLDRERVALYVRPNWKKRSHEASKTNPSRRRDHPHFD